jgi:hypothetical protein
MSSSDAKNSSVIPNVQTYGFAAGASSPRESAFMTQQQTAAKQNELNNQHGGYTYTRKKHTKRRGGSRIIVPQASTGGMVAAGPNDGNAAATTAAQHLTQSNANAKYDNDVGQPGTVTQVAGGKRRRRRRTRKYRKRSYQKGCSSRRSHKHGKYTAKNFKKHYMWNTKGKRYVAKTYKQHMKGVKLGHTHSKPKRRSVRRKSKKGGKRHRKGGYPFQKWGCFS